MRRKACIVKRGQSWAVKQPIGDGKYRWTTIGPRKRDAEALRDELNRRVLLGAAYTEPPRSFGAVRRAWLEAYERRSAPASVAIARSALRNLDEFDSRACETIRADEVEALVSALARTRARMA